MARSMINVYFERLFLVIMLGFVCLLLLVVGEERASAQSVYSTGLVAVTYFVGERTGSLGFSGGPPTYLGVSVWLVYFVSFGFLVFISVSIDLDDSRKRNKVWCQLSILSCATIYCSAKLGVVNVLIERLRLIRNTGLPRLQDRYWKLTMMLILPYGICLIFLLLDEVHTYTGTSCYIGITRRGIIPVLTWNMITSIILGVLYLRAFMDTDNAKDYHIPRGMTKTSIVCATVIWILTTCANLGSYLIVITLREHVCLMACASDVIVGILVSDYLSGLTAARIQQDEMALVVANKVVNMDLDNLEYLFEIENPSVIQSSFKSITAILRQYKAYVPASVLENIGDIINVGSTPVIVVQPPTENATLVFTDIVSSSMIWGELPDEMRDSLLQHNRIIRECIATCKGYEVKTIGDSFMVAFDSPSNGVEFGMLIQLSLFEALWPERLCQLPPCASGTVWNGLRVRIGVNHGQVNTDCNDATGKVDYLGATVNIAARLEGACNPGAVAVSVGTLQLAQEYIKQSSPLIIDKGPVSLRGIKEAVGVSILFPSSLSGRIEKTETVYVPENKEQTIAIRGSVSDCSSDSKYAVRRKQTEANFKKITATVGRHSVRPQPSDYTLMNETLGLVATCLVRTDGTVMGVTGNVVTFSWNVSKPSDNHSLTSLRFADMYASYQKRGYSNALRSVMSLSSSALQTGFVRAGEQKFVTVLGDALGLTTSQLHLAEDSEIFCTYTSSNEKDLNFLSPVLREIGKVTVSRTMNYPQKVAVFEVSVAGWASQIEMDFGSDKLVLETPVLFFPETKATEVEKMRTVYC